MAKSANEIRVGIHRRDFLQLLAAGGAGVAGASVRPASAGATTNITAGWQVKWGGQLVACHVPSPLNLSTVYPLPARSFSVVSAPSVAKAPLDSQSPCG